jgi:hypothetical protein
VEYEGKTYCWDWDLKKVVKIEMKPVPFASCPEEVLAAMLSGKTVPYGTAWPETGTSGGK